MFCPQCGTGNPEGAAACMKCGASMVPAQVVVPPGYTPNQQIPNYLVQAILVTILCCLPLGIPAIIYSAQVNGKLASGDIAGAMAASKNAKLFCWISFWVGLGVSILGFMMGISGVFFGARH
jgi:hypothetical protein